MKKFSLILVTVLWSGCNIPAPLEKVADQLKNLMGMPKTSPTPSASATPALSPEAATTKANAELMAEMLQVTFHQKEIEDDAQFKSLVSSLNQGASLEGIYRGLIMASKYRALESNAKAASPDAIKFFALEMAEIQMTMKNPTVFNKDTAKRLPEIDYPEGGDGTPDSYTFGDTPEKKSSKKTKESVAEEILQDFIGATPFTLKRVLTEEVLKKMDEMKDSPADMAQWYAGQTVRLAGANTDFGLPQRNSDDFDFHSRFAKTMSVDRVKWEMLNRYLRIINRIE